ncbi:MAG: CHAP domain-containing protein [Flavipsychrobacter sp.]|nr:CHAP domain-containing protein [Flavipsychrobacter sp.]
MALINPGNDVGSSTLATLALQIAQGQVGQCEKPIGSNSGPMVNEYLKAVGLNPGYAWCQAFVYWCYQQAAQQIKNGNPVTKTGGAVDCWHKTAVQFKITQAEALRDPKILQPGYQFILSFGNGAGHTGIIEKIEDTLLYTIEGNSNNNGSREGYEVVRHQRHINDKLLVGIIRY